MPPFPILACGPSGPEFLVILGLIFAIPLFSALMSLVGLFLFLQSKRRFGPWIYCGFGFIGGIPGAICFLQMLSHGSGDSFTPVLFGACPITFAIGVAVTGIFTGRTKASEENR